MSMGRLPRISACGFAAVLAASCAINDHFDGQVGRLDRTIEAARSSLILTNIVRASRELPLSFISVPTIHASNGTISNIGLPQIVFGPGQTVAQHQSIIGGTSPGSANNINFNGSTSFDVTVLESKDFYRGLLTPVSPRTVAFFVAQGMPREMLFYLFVDKIIIGEKGRKHELSNDPGHPTFSEFRSYVTLAMQYGLTTEVVPSIGESRERRPFAATAEAGTGRAQEQRERQATRMCFEPRFATQRLNNVSPICGSPVPPGLRNTVGVVMTANGPRTIEVLPRSTFEIFHYLGRIVAEGDNGLIKLISEDATREGSQHDDTLFRVERGATGSCYVDIDYAGERYCVPLSGAPNSTRIVGLLVQLVALNTAIADLPLTQTVRIAQ